MGDTYDIHPSLPVSVIGLYCKDPPHRGSPTHPYTSWAAHKDRGVMAGVISHSPGVSWITSSSSHPVTLAHFTSCWTIWHRHQSPPNADASNKSTEHSQVCFTLATQPLTIVSLTTLICLYLILAFLPLPQGQNPMSTSWRRLQFRQWKMWVSVTKACLTSVYPPSGQVSPLFALLRPVFTQKWEENESCRRLRAAPHLSMAAVVLYVIYYRQANITNEEDQVSCLW